MAPKGRTRKKKLVPVQVDRTSRWGTTKAKQASADLGRAIRNVLSEMGIEPTRIANAFSEGREIEKRVDQLEMGRMAVVDAIADLTTGFNRDLNDLRQSLKGTVLVLDRLVAERGQPVAIPAPPPSATGTTTHSMRIDAVRLDGGVLWAPGLGCSCGIRFVNEDAMVSHLASVRRT